MSDTTAQLIAAVVGAVVPILVAAINDWLKRIGGPPEPAAHTPIQVQGPGPTPQPPPPRYPPEAS